MFEEQELMKKPWMNHVDPIKCAYEDCELLKKYITGTLKTHNEKSFSR